MTTRNKPIAWLALAAIAGAMLLAAMPASAQQVGFNTSTFARGDTCNENGRCSLIQLFEGKSPGGTDFLTYEMSWVIDPIAYDLTGAGFIPATTVHFSGKTALALNVDTSTVPGFFSQLCFFNNSTQESGCSSPSQLPVVIMNIQQTGFETERGTSSTFFNVLNFSDHIKQTFTDTSATGSASIGDQSFPNEFAFLGIAQDVVIDITRGQ
jgi:hypothetical protein